MKGKEEELRGIVARDLAWEYMRSNKGLPVLMAFHL